MISIYTPERAERLASSFRNLRTYVVQRALEPHSVLSTRGYGDLIVATRLYARVYRNGAHYFNITYEAIDSGSVIW